MAQSALSVIPIVGNQFAIFFARWFRLQTRQDRSSKHYLVSHPEVLSRVPIVSGR